MSRPVWMARRALSWPMISSQARASALDSTGTRSGQQVQRSASGDSSGNPLFVLMPQLLETKLSQYPRFLKAAKPAARDRRPTPPIPGHPEKPDAVLDELQPDIC